eukprot:XP_001707425.1 Hypothetical protein GL50803_21461 [Giardia lamblia ATCC 50803]
MTLSVVVTSTVANDDSIDNNIKAELSDRASWEELEEDGIGMVAQFLNKDAVARF